MFLCETKNRCRLVISALEGLRHGGNELKLCNKLNLGVTRSHTYISMAIRTWDDKTSLLHRACLFSCTFLWGGPSFLSHTPLCACLATPRFLRTFTSKCINLFFFSFRLKRCSVCPFWPSVFYGAGKDIGPFLIYLCPALIRSIILHFSMAGLNKAGTRVYHP